MNRTVLLLPLLLCAACTISENHFPDAYARAICTRLAQCEAGQYQNTYDNRRDCVSSWSDAAQSVLDAGDLVGATYSPTKAAQCIDQIHAASCGDFSNFDYTCQVFE